MKNKSVSHNVCYDTLSDYLDYDTLSDYLDGRDKAFCELVYLLVQLCRRWIKLRQCCNETDVCSEEHRKYFASLCEVAHFEGYVERVLSSIDENFSLSLLQNAISNSSLDENFSLSVFQNEISK